MTHRTWAHRWFVRLASFSAVAALPLVVGGCAGTPKPQGDVVQTDGASLRLDSTGSTHQVIFTAPSAGWSLAFDRAESASDAQRVYITARKPDPAMLHAQQLVDLRLDTTVPSTKRIHLHYRVMNHGQASGTYSELVR